MPWPGLPTFSQTHDGFPKGDNTQAGLLALSCVDDRPTDCGALPYVGLSRFALCQLCHT